MTERKFNPGDRIIAKNSAFFWLNDKTLRIHAVHTVETRYSTYVLYEVLTDVHPAIGDSIKFEEREIDFAPDTNPSPMRPVPEAGYLDREPVRQ